MARSKEFDEALILNKAMRLFWEKGYNATSAQDLVSGLEISRSSLYDTFGDKHSLYISTLNYYRREMSGIMIRMIHESEDAEQSIREIFSFLTRKTEKVDKPKGCFMVNATIELADQDPEVGQIVQSNLQDVEDALTLAVQKGQDAGQFNRKHSARTMARFIFNNISGIRVASKSGATDQGFDDIIGLILSALK